MVVLVCLAVATLPSVAASAKGAITVLELVARCVTLIPSHIGALPSGICIAGMARLVRFSVLAMSERAVKAGGAGTRHRLISHNSKYIRQNRGTSVMADADAKKIKSYMPYA